MEWIYEVERTQIQIVRATSATAAVLKARETDDWVETEVEARKT